MSRTAKELGLDTDTVTVTLEKRGEAPIVRPAQPSGWDRFFADDSLALPEDFLLGEDPAPQDRERSFSILTSLQAPVRSGC